MMKQRYRQSDSNHKKIEKYSDSEEETELLVRTKPPKREVSTVEKVIEEGDTLQSLAIRYQCTIEDLKRLNNIHKENEIFAKRTIKVPHRTFSMALASVHISGTSSPEEALKPMNAGDLSVKLNTTLGNLKQDSKELEVNEIVFNSSIAQKNPETHSNELDIDEDEKISLLPNEQIQSEPITSKMDCSGVDGDISIKTLFLFITLLIVVVPLVYVFYIAEHLEQYHHHL